VPLKYSKGGSEVFAEVRSQRRIISSFRAEVLEEEIERSKFSEEK
jgi:hypothetical protein